MIGWRFEEWTGQDGDNKSPFDRLFPVFQELLLHASGDVAETLSWLTELDKEYNITDDKYGIGDFIEDLIEQGFISGNDDMENFRPTAKMEQSFRKSALKEIFGSVQKAKKGDHNTKKQGKGDEFTDEIRPYNFGDSFDQIALTESFKNAQINHGLENFRLEQDDLAIRETFFQSQMSTVLMIDISHSMILYGEDRITPAKQVALALSEYIMTRFPKDTLDILVFGDEAWQVSIRDLPYLQVGPYHTNTVAGLELALELLRKRRNPNKQVFMITDGKPTCIKVGKQLYKNSFGLDQKIINRTLNLGAKFKKLGIPVTTFMIARDPYLMRFVEAFTAANAGKAFYSSLDGLGDFIFKDYKSSRKSRK
ncbi:MAG: VWA domain-containing protein [Saprospiraceae bacterium]